MNADIVVEPLTWRWTRRSYRSQTYYSRCPVKSLNTSNNGLILPIYIISAQYRSGVFRLPVALFALSDDDVIASLRNELQMFHNVEK